MPSDKDRLYVALYVRGGQPTLPGGEDAYYWALIVGPKSEPKENGQGIRYRVKEKRTTDSGELLPAPIWTYDEQKIGLQPNEMLLVRIVIGKIIDVRRLNRILTNVPTRPDTPGWDCFSWVKEAVERTLEDGGALGTCAGDWKTIRDVVMWYIGHKKDHHRFDGQGDYDMTKVPTWDMLEAKELTK